MTTPMQILPLARPGLLAELRALLAVTKRSWLHLIRYPSWIVQMFVWPLIFPAMYILTARALAGPDGSGMQVFIQNTGITDYMGYIVVGTVVWMWQNIVLWDVGFTLRQEQMRGTLETSWMSPARRFSLLVGGSFVQFLTMLFFMIITALEFSLFFGLRFHANLPGVLAVVAAAIPSIYGVGFAFASLVISLKEAHNFVFMVRGLVMIFCGISYPISVLPGWMAEVARWLPPTYIINGLRKAALANASVTELLPELIPLAGFGVFWMGFGYVVFKMMERRARQTGAIGQY